MSVLKPRNRLVNFRLTEEEFEELRRSSAAQGARSVSDFARGAVMRQVEQPRVAESLAGLERLREVDEMVIHLEQRVAQILKLVDAVGVTVASEANEPVAH